MTPEQSRAVARWLAWLPIEEALAVKARIREAPDEWRALRPAEQEAALLAYRNRPRSPTSP